MFIKKSYTMLNIKIFFLIVLLLKQFRNLYNLKKKYLNFFSVKIKSIELYLTEIDKKIINMRTIILKVKLVFHWHKN